MAVAMQQTVAPPFLLTQWQTDGWAMLQQAVLAPIAVASDGSIDPHVQIDAFEWDDVSVFGIGNTGSAVAQFQQQIAGAGSSLFAWAIFSRPRFDALGIKITSYRLVLCHSQVQLLAWAVAIVAAAFAAVIFIQYITTGQSPAVKDLQNLWGSAVTSIGTGIGNAGGGIANAYIWATVASGAVLILISRVAKDQGVRAPAVRPPQGSVSVHAGPATVKAGT